jgi:hypothetical protein
VNFSLIEPTIPENEHAEKGNLRKILEEKHEFLREKHVLEHFLRESYGNNPGKIRESRKSKWFPLKV